MWSQVYFFSVQDNGPGNADRAGIGRQDVGDFPFLFSLEGNTAVCQLRFSLKMGLNGGRRDFSFHFAPLPVALGFFSLGILVDIGIC